MFKIFHQTDRVWRLAAFAGLSIAAVGMFATLVSIFFGRSALDVDETLKLAVEAYNVGDFETSDVITRSLKVSPDWNDTSRRMHAFLAAASGVQRGLLIENDQERRIRISSELEGFQHSASLGFPEQYEYDAIWLLGTAYYETGDYTGAANAWGQRTRTKPEDSRKYLIKLAEAQFRSAQYPATSAQKTIETFLNLPTINSTERADGNLLLGRILAQRKQWQEALAVLARVVTIPESELRGRLAQAQVHLGVAKQRLEDHDPNLPIPEEVNKTINDAFDDLVEVSRIADDITALDATYVAGEAMRLQREFDKSLGLLGSVRQNRLDAGVALAAGLQELEILSRHGTAEECMSTSTYLVGTIGDPRAFDPRWVSLENFRTRLSQAIESLKRRGEYNAGIQIIREMQPIVQRGTALRVEGEVYAMWAASLAQSRDPKIAASAKDYHDRSGRAFHAAAQESFTSLEYPKHLWNAIVQFDKAHRFAHNLDLLNSYLQYETRDQVPRGLILKGRTQLSLGDYEKALQTFNTCIVEFPRDSLKYEARILAARGAFELGRIHQAREQLESNLHDGFLAPESKAWRDSLLALGEYLYIDATGTHLSMTTPNPNKALPKPAAVADQFRKNQELFLDAIERLEEAQIRYQDLRETRYVRYLLAQAHRNAAHWPKIEAQLPDTQDSGRRELNQKYMSHLSSAVQSYRQLRDELNQVSDNNSLSTREQTMLRNCYLGEADALFQMEEYNEAITVYRATVNRFINEPMSLEALMQQSQCYEALGEMDDVKRLLKQAKQILDRIPTEYDEMFVQTTRYDRKGWTEFLDWLSQS